MTDKRKAPDAPEGRRKRAAPTIDLTATEVPPAERTAQAAPEAEHEKPPEPPREQVQAAPEAPPAAQEPPHHGFGGIAAASIAAGFIGAFVGVALLAALWWSGVLPSGTAAGDQSAAIAALRSQVQALQSRPAPAADTQAVDALRQTVRKLEGDIAKLPRGDATMAARLTAIDNAMNALSAEIGKLDKRSDAIAATANQAQQSAAAAEKAASDMRANVQNAAQQASTAVDPAQLDALRKQVTALEQSLQSARADIAKTPAIDKAARLALSAVALHEAVAGGAPYQAELAQAKRLGADEQALAPLTQFASTGLPSKSALANELHALIPVLLKTSGVQKAPAGFLARLEANASKIVRINPVDAPQGDTPSDVLARLEVDAAHDDITAALADIGKLPEAARAPALGFIAKVKARQAALAASRRFAANSARALGEKRQ